MKFFVTLVLCFSMAQATLAESIFSRLAKSFAVKFNALTKDYEVRKVYTANTFDFDSEDQFKQPEILEKNRNARTVLIEIWDHKTNSQVLLVSPQGTTDFFQIKNLSYLRSNDESLLQHIVGDIYVEKNGHVEKVTVGLFKDQDSVTLSSGSTKFTLDRLTPEVEKDLINRMKTEITRDSWSQFGIKRAYEIHGRLYFEIESKDLTANLLQIDSVTGQLVRSDLHAVTTPLMRTHFIENGKIKLTLGDEGTKKLSTAEMAKALDYKTFDFKSLTETVAIERSFSPELYIQTGSGRDLFISKIKLEGVNQFSIMSAMYRDVSFDGVAVIETMLGGSVLKFEYKVRMEYTSDGVFLSLFDSAGPKNVLKINIKDKRNPVIVQNDWMVQLVGKPFDKNFKRVSDTYQRINELKGPKVLRCEKLF